jgi:hypothetical protein
MPPGWVPFSDLERHVTEFHDKDAAARLSKVARILQGMAGAMPSEFKLQLEHKGRKSGPIQNWRALDVNWETGQVEVRLVELLKGNTYFGDIAESIGFGRHELRPDELERLEGEACSLLVSTPLIASAVGQADRRHRRELRRTRLLEPDEDQIPSIWIRRGKLLCAIRQFLALHRLSGSFRAEDLFPTLLLACERSDACCYTLLLQRGRYRRGRLRSWIALGEPEWHAWQAQVCTKRLLARSWDPLACAEQFGIAVPGRTALKAEERLARLGVFAPDTSKRLGWNAFTLAAQLGIEFDADVTLREAETILLRFDGKLVPFAIHRDTVEAELRQIYQQWTPATQQPALPLSASEPAAARLQPEPPSPQPVRLDSVSPSALEQLRSLRPHESDAMKDERPTAVSVPASGSAARLQQPEPPADNLKPNDPRGLASQFAKEHPTWGQRRLWATWNDPKQKRPHISLKYFPMLKGKGRPPGS